MFSNGFYIQNRSLGGIKVCVFVIIIIGFIANKFCGTPHFVNFCNQSINFTMTYDQQIINNDIFTKKTTVNLQVYRRNHTSYHTIRKVYCYAHDEYTKSRTNMDDCYLSAFYIHLTEIGLHPGQFTDQCKVNIMSVLISYIGVIN